MYEDDNARDGFGRSEEVVLDGRWQIADGRLEIGDKELNLLSAELQSPISNLPSTIQLITMRKNIVNKILIVNLSNIGDVILTLPAIDLIKGNFPDAKITMLVGPKAKALFEKDSRIDNLIIYDKRKPFTDKIGLTFRLRKYRFDMILDFRHTAFPVFLGARYKSAMFRRENALNQHRKEVYLDIAKSIYPFDARKQLAPRISSSSEDEKYIDDLLKNNKISVADKIIVVSAGAASYEKRWAKEGFIQLCDLLIKEFSVKVIFVGDEFDSKITDEIISGMKNNAVNLCGKTSLKQLALVLHKCQLLISNDSAVMHMGSYLNIPVLAIFGHTDPAKYGPWNNKSRLVRKELSDLPYPSSDKYKLEYMQRLKPEDVFEKAKAMLQSKIDKSIDIHYKRILITRTDRIGDVVLSTPAIKGVRDYYPNAFIAVMVRPYAKDIVEGNPCIDEVIVYDKFGIHKKFLNTFKFALNLRKRKFDLAIMLHPTNRVHIISFVAGVRERIGYDRKFSFLLTKKIKHTKQLGEKHESEYALDVIRELTGIKAQNSDLFMPIKQESEAYIDDILRKQGYNNSQKLIAIHPGASCPSKRWMPERFAEVANKLVEKYKAKIAIVASKDDLKTAHFVINAIRYPVIDLSARTTVSELASLLKRCKVFISNDSGPVHISSAVGTPVISIFGRKQAGLGPKRWGPLGKNDKIIHKDVNCLECLAHNCQKEFLCLKAVSVSEVMEYVDTFGDKLR